MRIAMGVEYDGSGYCGWQWQPGRRTIQAELEAGIAAVANGVVRVMGAGRTDAGVHATGQVVHFDTEVYRKPHSWLMGTNSFLPDDCRVLWVKEVTTDFHARASAIARYYRYLILNRNVKSALHRNRLTCVPRTLSTEAMQLAAQHLIGDHDFSSFRAQGCQSRSPRRFMHFIMISREEDRVTVDICANAFLHHMVRNIVGVLIDIGVGKHAPEWAAQLLAARNRSLGGVTAPPHGLYFAGIYYPDSFQFSRHAMFRHLPADAQRYKAPDQE